MNTRFSSGRRDLAVSADDFAAISDMIFGFTNSQLVHCAAIYSLAEHLSGGPLSSHQIANLEGLNIDATFRFLRACAAFGLLDRTEPDRFSATPLLMTLHKDVAGSMRALALAMPGRGHWAPWGQLCDAVRTGEMQSRVTLGTDIWDYYANPSGAFEGQAFIDAVASLTGAAAHEAAQLIDTKSVNTAVDVGGGIGILVRELMKKNPALKGTVLDLPHVVAKTRGVAMTGELQNHLEVVGGNFLKEVPSADLHLLQSVLCDWSDQDCLTILRNCRRSANMKGRIAILDLLVEDTQVSPLVARADLTMMVILGARIRTLAEYEDLLAQSGFAFSRAIRTSTPFTLIEAMSS